MSDHLTCEKCRGTNFFAGPSGGMSQNYICGNPACRARYCVSPFGSEFVGFDPSEAELAEQKREETKKHDDILQTHYDSGVDHYAMGGSARDIPVPPYRGYMPSQEDLARARFAGFLDALAVDVRVSKFQSTMEN